MTTLSIDPEKILLFVFLAGVIASYIAIVGEPDKYMTLGVVGMTTVTVISLFVFYRVFLLTKNSKTWIPKAEELDNINAKAYMDFVKKNPLHFHPDGRLKD